MTGGVGLEVKGEKNLHNILSKMVKNIGDVKPVLRSIAIDLERVVVPDHFASEGGEKHWPRLSEKTIKLKRRKGWPPNQMIRTGAGLRSLTGGKGHVRKIGKTFFRYGSRLRNRRGQPYLAFHHFGRRPLLVATQTDLDRWARWTLNYVNRVKRGNIKGKSSSRR